MTTEEYWAQIRAFKVEADAITLQVRILEIRRSALAHRMQDAYDKLTASLSAPEA